MKKVFTLLAAALMSASMFGKTIQENISINAGDWMTDKCYVNNQGDELKCMNTGEFGTMTYVWSSPIDLTSYTKLVVVVNNMSGCDGEWEKLKAYVRDNADNRVETALGLDAPDNAQNEMVIDLKQQTNCDLTQAKFLTIQCQPNGSIYKIGRVYLEKEVEDDGTTSIDQMQGNKVLGKKAQKVFRNGQLYIIQGSKTYSITGVEVK